MKKNILNTLLALVALALPACTDDDTPFGSQTNPLAGQLHITSVTIDGGEVASRAVYEGEGTDSYNYNRSVTGFATGDKLGMVYGFTTETPNAKAQLVKTDVGWDIRDVEGNALVIRPASGEKWENFTGSILYGEDPKALTEDLKSAYNIVQDDVPTTNNYLFKDQLTASDNAVTVDTDLNSPTLGTMEIKLSHVHSLLQLPESAISISGSFLIDGKEYTNASLATLWAVRSENGETGANATHYVPLTSVTINGKEYLQAIIRQGSLTGFKAVMKSGEGENVEYFTLGLPFKVGTSTSASTSYTLQPNYRYPLTLTITPTTASVTLTNTGKPGWGDTEIKLEQAYDVVYVTYEEMASRSVQPGSYDAGGTFEVYTPKGLQLVSQWMNNPGDAGTGIAFIEKYKPEDIGLADNKDFRMKQNIRLMKDLDFTSVDTKESFTLYKEIDLDYEEGASEEPDKTMTVTGTGHLLSIGGYEHGYTGVFDGNYKTIKGLKIVSASSISDGGAGLVGWLGHSYMVNYSTEHISSVMKDLTLENCSLIATSASNAGLAVGNVHMGGEITNVHVTGTATINASGSIGGLAGHIANAVVLTDCSNSAAVAVTKSTTESSYNNVGGLVGNISNGVLRHCWNSGTVTTDFTTVTVGGLVGSSSGIIVACSNTSTEALTGDASSMGIYGCYSSSKIVPDETTTITLNGCYVGEISEVNSHIDDMNKAIVEYNVSNGPNYIPNQKSIKDWVQASTGYPTYTGINAITVTFDDVVYEAGTDGATGTFKVYTAAGLMKVNQWMMGSGEAPSSNVPTDVDKLAQNITLMRDIDLSNQTWTPLGDATTPYTGTIQGNMCTLSGLTINVTLDYAGLVGYLKKGGEVLNLFLNSPSVTGTNYVGTVAGYNEDGRIFTCQVRNATVTGTGDYVGGIAGSHNDADNTVTYGVVRCLMTGGSVKGTTNATHVGSIVGYNGGESAYVIACGSTATTENALAGVNEGRVYASWYWNDDIAGTRELNDEEGATTPNDTTDDRYYTCYVFQNAATANSVELNEDTGSYEYVYIKKMVNVAFAITSGNGSSSWLPGNDPGKDWPTLAIDTGSSN